MPPEDQAAQPVADPPARVGRLTALQGTVSFEPASDTEWGAAEPNRPVTTGDRVWSDTAGRAEIEMGTAAVRVWRETELDVTRLDDNSLQLRIPQGTVAVRLSTFTDGETAEIPCWVRNIDGNNFQVFAINCAHLGCPVRWFPKSRLFMCTCHGGAYYEDGSRASGPPERGLFQYPFKVLDGKLQIQAGELPTPGPSAANRELINIRRQSPCA